MEDVLQLVLVYTAITVVFSIPSFFLIHQYRQTKIKDYLFFTSFFGFIFLSTLFEPILQISDNLIFYQLRLGIHNIAWIMLLYQTLRMSKLSTIRSWRWYIGLIWFVLLEFMIILWKPITQPDNISVLGISYHHSSSLVFPEGAGFELDGTLIFSSDYRILAEMFWIYVALIFLINHIKLNLVYPTPRTIRARKLWIISFSLFLVYYLPAVLTLNNFRIPEILIVISIFIIGGIAVYYPEAILLSDNVIIRIPNLASLIENLTNQKAQNVNINKNLMNYLELLADEFKMKELNP
ncbi:MAG: hypothetical protein GPJ54_04185 [Candidatus Heimdallarchaeota archaeon]|nr:hypothetical protein [Candidatus Heimdallarchaeota archaeon]